MFLFLLFKIEKVLSDLGPELSIREAQSSRPQAMSCSSYSWYCMKAVHHHFACLMPTLKIQFGMNESNHPLCSSVAPS